jgi:large subunit ribosomal protein L13
MSPFVTDLGLLFHEELSRMKTYAVKAGDIERKWYVADAEGKPLGRFASGVARILKGKHKPTYSPHLDTGDHVIVVNASKVVVTGRKAEQKRYVRHSGYPGGLKSVPYAKLMSTRPEKILEHAIKGMLPHSSLGRQMFRKLRVYAGPEHRQQAQKPEPLQV